MNQQHEATTALRAEFERWDALLGSLSEAQITAPQLSEGWSIKDVVAHLYAWQQRSIARMAAALHGGEPAFPPWPTEFDPEMEGQPHDLNAWLYAQTRDLPWSDIYHRWHDGFLRFLELSEALPASDLLDTAKYEWLEGYAMIDVLEGSREHHREHAENLDPVLEQMKLR